MTTDGVGLGLFVAEEPHLLFPILDAAVRMRLHQVKVKGDYFAELKSCFAKKND